MSKALTMDELSDLFQESDCGVHVWVEIIDLDSVYAAILDDVDGIGMEG